MKTHRFLQQALLLIVSTALTLGAADGLPSATSTTRTAAYAAAQTLPVEALLNPDGTLHPATDFRGSLDLRGWNVILDTARGPVFHPASSPSARLDAETWNPLGTGLGNTVRTVVISGTEVYAGGLFTSAGTCNSAAGCNYIAKWNGSAWSALGTGMVGVRVNAIAINGTDVYAGGTFTSAGTCTSGCNRIAKWDGAAWSALGMGINNAVNTVVASNTDVYAGGAFTSAGTCDSAAGCNRIAKWDGSTWSALGTGIGGMVYAIAVNGTDVYAGGNFTSAGICNSAAGCNRIAKWNGTTWSALGTGMGNGYVTTIAIDGTDVYAGGLFTSAGTCDSAAGCNYIAKWNGTTWSALGTGANAYVYAIAINGTDVYVGGSFSSAGTCTSGCNSIAKWDGSTWSALGTGASNYVYAIAITDTDVYAGGAFTSAGTCDSAAGCNYSARWGSSPVTLAYAEPAPGACGGNTPCYASLQAAVDTVAAGGEVRYYGGTFNEPVNLNKNVTLSFVGSSDVTIGGAFTISAGTFNAPAANTLSLTGDLTNSGGTFNHNSGTVIFAGSGTQTITGDFTFNNLTVNSGAALDVGTYTLNVVGSGVALSNQQDATGTADFTFLGSTGVVINPGASLPLGTTDATIRFLPAGTTSCVSGGQPTVRRCFQINPTHTTGRNATVRFYFDATRDLNGLTCAALKAYHHAAGGGWSLAGGTGGVVTCNGAASYIEVSGVTDFSDFVLGDASNKPTAITLRAFSAAVGPDGIWPYIGIGLALAGLVIAWRRRAR